MVKIASFLVRSSCILLTLSIISMANYTLSVAIDRNQFQFLRANDYKLCISRETNGKYTTVWSAIEFNERHHFRWSEEFQIYWMQNFAEGIEAEAECNPVPIAYGQTVTIQPDTSLSDAAGTPDDSGSFKVINKTSIPLNIALSAQICGEWGACFVSPYKVMAGCPDTLTPLTKVKVWFSQSNTGGSMITEVNGPFINVLFDGTTKHKVSFSGAVSGAGVWALTD